MTAAEIAAFARGWRVPDTFSPVEGARLCTEALKASAAAVAAVKARFRGTLPPPPWPAGPALVTARKRLGVLCDGLAALDRRGVTKIAAARMPALAAALRTEGGTLLRETATLADRAAASPSGADVVRRAVGGVPWVLVGAVAFLWFDRDGDVRW